jgi:hypothetical protein
MVGGWRLAVGDGDGEDEERLWGLCCEFDLDVGRREEIEGFLKWDLRWDCVGIFEWLRGERLHTVLAMEELAV